MPIDLILSAYSSNSGGGRSGLLSLLNSMPPNIKTVAFVDQRLPLNFKLPEGVQIQTVAPTFWGRYSAERKIRNLARSARWVLRLGSVPPIYDLGIPTYVFFENRYLLNGTSLVGLPLKTRLRLHLERRMLNRYKGNASKFIVQSASVAVSLTETLGPGNETSILPFHQAHVAQTHPAGKTCDFIYLASGDVHKNHKNLFLAWALLAQENLRPSLRLTVDPKQHPELCRELADLMQKYSLKIENLGSLSPADALAQNEQARAAIFPSTLESFGRPLIEARDAGLAILAPELDYVRDLVDPAQTFDPHSPLSIARAVKRHLGQPESRAAIRSSAEFLEELSRLARS